MNDLAWPLPMDTLSPSALSKFQRCAEQFRRQYLKGEWDRASVSAVVGNAVHESAETNFRQKTTSYVDLPVAEIEEAYAAAFDHEVEENGGVKEIDWEMKVGQRKQRVSPGEAKDRGAPLARMYRESIAPRIQPLGTEEWFRIRVPGVPVPLRGKIDTITANAKLDMKFGGTAKQRIDNSWLIPAYVYMLANETTERNGDVRLGNIGHLPFVWHTGSWGGPRSEPRIHTPMTTPDLSLLHTPRVVRVAQANIKGTVDHMLAMYRLYGPDDPWPTSALNHGWVCSFCPIHPDRGGDCHWWTGTTRQDTL